MTKQNIQKVYSPCGGHCRCGADAADSGDRDCAVPEGGVALDAEGKCPCGKGADECCHKEVLKKNSGDSENPALRELCKPHGKAHLCGV